MVIGFLAVVYFAMQNPVRGACWFELQFSAAGGGGVSVLSAESEADMQDWTDKLTRVLHADKMTNWLPDRSREKSELGYCQTIGQV